MSSWNRQPTGLEPTCQGGETMPTREGGKQHLCLRFVSMSSYALEQKGLEPTIVWRELMPMLEYMRNHASTHTRMVVYVTIRTTTSVYINAQHTQHDKDDAPTTVIIQLLRCITSPYTPPSTLSARCCNSSPVDGFRAMACSISTQYNCVHMCFYIWSVVIDVSWRKPPRQPGKPLVLEYINFSFINIWSRGEAWSILDHHCCKQHSGQMLAHPFL